MLRSVNQLRGYRIAARDGNLGKARDLLFDDAAWRVRYLVVDTGTWLPGRKVLVSPEALLEPDWTGKLFPVDLTREQVEKSPPLEADKPVSRRYAEQLGAHYAWTTGFAAPGPVVPPVPRPGMPEDTGDPHLRSVDEVSGYGIAAEDGDIGHVEDFIVDDVAWTLRYMIVDTRNWLPGRKVLVAPQWIDDVDWGERRVRVSMSREEVEKSPEFDPSEPVNREYEVRLFDYYGRPAYWEEPAEKK